MFNKIEKVVDINRTYWKYLKKYNLEYIKTLKDVLKKGPSDKISQKAYLYYANTCPDEFKNLMEILDQKPSEETMYKIYDTIVKREIYGFAWIDIPITVKAAFKDEYYPHFNFEDLPKLIGITQVGSLEEILEKYNLNEDQKLIDKLYWKYLKQHKVDKVKNLKIILKKGPSNKLSQKAYYYYANTAYIENFKELTEIFDYTPNEKTMYKIYDTILKRELRGFTGIDIPITIKEAIHDDYYPRLKLEDIPRLVKLTGIKPPKELIEKYNLQSKLFGSKKYERIKNTITNINEIL